MVYASFSILRFSHTSMGQMFQHGIHVTILPLLLLPLLILKLRNALQNRFPKDRSRLYTVYNVQSFQALNYSLRSLSFENPSPRLHKEQRYSVDI